MSKCKKAFNHMHEIMEERALNNEDTLTQEEFDSLKELVDKETPMKPFVLRDTTEGYGDFIQANCRKCERELHYLQERCSSRTCGQVVDWTDGDV